MQALYRQAQLGNAQAKYTIGKMLYNPKSWNPQQYGLTANPVLGEKWIREAAIMGHEWAWRQVWIWDGRNPEELVEKYDDRGEEARKLFQPIIHTEVALLAVETCDSNLLLKVENALEQRTEDLKRALSPDDYEQFVEFSTRSYRVPFANNCGS